jgi:hypothetical protein
LHGARKWIFSLWHSHGANLGSICSLPLDFSSFGAHLIWRLGYYLLFLFKRLRWNIAVHLPTSNTEFLMHASIIWSLKCTCSCATLLDDNEAFAGLNLNLPPE